MEEKTMEVTKLKIEQNVQKHQRETRFKTFENFRDLKAKQDHDDLIKQFEEQFYVIDEKYIKQQIDQKAEEQEYYSQVYEKSMLANLDNINFEMPSSLEEEFI
ncbi:unnamed protein product [Paramecium primaurelia]|uniref:Uncharacterized protein n=1 Tax=Paramecium primaurelia TaxID=5886 RepID=A0A8S1KC68_PARPR|nr:unnamed protein product [Paramecium primaurelia]